MTSRLLSIVAKKPLLSTCLLSDAKLYFHHSAVNCKKSRPDASFLNPKSQIQEKFRRSDGAPGHWKLVYRYTEPVITYSTELSYRAPEQYIDNTKYIGQLCGLTCAATIPVLLTTKQSWYAFSGNFGMMQAGSYNSLRL